MNSELNKFNMFYDATTSNMKYIASKMGYDACRKQFVNASYASGWYVVHNNNKIDPTYDVGPYHTEEEAWKRAFELSKCTS